MSLNLSFELVMQATLQLDKPFYLRSLLSYHEIEFMVFARNYCLKKNSHLILHSATSFWYFSFIPLSLQLSLLHFHYCSADVNPVSEVNNPSAP